jgi:hypothetical protein
LSPALTDIIGARRVRTAVMISSGSIPCRYRPYVGPARQPREVARADRRPAVAGAGNAALVDAAVTPRHRSFALRRRDEPDRAGHVDLIRPLQRRGRG